MKIDVLKSEFHELIDKINDPEILIQFYDALIQSTKSEGSLWNSLTADQQQQVLDAYDESEVESNLIPSSIIRSKYK